jgi:DNA-binding response OmpR family regulator
MASGTQLPRHILIVDDDPMMCDLTRLILTNAGYSAATANTAEDALVQIAETLPRLILTDMVLPGMDGSAFCRALRDNPRSRKIPVVILSASDEARDRTAALQAGADDYLVKPFSPPQLVERVRTLLAPTNR